jgi:hypothetical protein
MSVQINNVNQNIDLTKGDSFSFTLNDAITGLPYVFGATDVVTFTVRKSINSEIEFDIVGSHDAENHITIDITPADTNESDYGRYYYDIQWVKTGGWTKTIIPTNPTQLPEFNICQEITKAVE